MMKLRPEQLYALGAAILGPFEDATLKRLERVYPRRFAQLGVEGVRGFVRRVIETALVHRIEERRLVSVLIDLMMEYGEDFERAPDGAWARRMLQHPRLPGELRVQVIADRLRAAAGGRVIEPVTVEKGDGDEV